MYIYIYLYCFLLYIVSLFFVFKWYRKLSIAWIGHCIGTERSGLTFHVLICIGCLYCTPKWSIVMSVFNFFNVYFLFLLAGCMSTVVKISWDYWHDIVSISSIPQPNISSRAVGLNICWFNHFNTGHLHIMIW